MTTTVILNRRFYGITATFYTDIVNQNSETLLSTASICSTFLQNSFKPTSQSKILCHGFTESNVQKVYQLPFTITKEIKIIMFQYKIIHNILPTQMSLYRDGLSDNDICLLCNTEKQTLNHLLVNCLKTTSFWKLFEDWWYGKSQERLSLTQSNILYVFFSARQHTGRRLTIQSSWESTIFSAQMVTKTNCVSERFFFEFTTNCKYLKRVQSQVNAYTNSSVRGRSFCNTSFITF